jgi:predicted DNA-binding transcriptional regulator AlpA
MTDEDYKLKTLKEVAAMVGKDTGTISRWLNLGYFPQAWKRLGSKPYWTRRQVLDWLNERQTDANEPKQLP